MRIRKEEIKGKKTHSMCDNLFRVEAYGTMKNNERCSDEGDEFFPMIDVEI